MINQSDRKKNLSACIIVVLYAIGFFGILSPYRNFFLLLTPINLLLSTILLYINHKEFNKSFVVFSIFCYLAGFFIEVVGVKTGIIFGEYSYGATLGKKLFDVPLIMGCNWLMLIYSAGVICEKINVPLIVKCLIGATMLVSLDLLIEPVAIKFDFWNWQQLQIPIQNYVAWFVTSVILLFIFYKLPFNKNNQLAKVLYIVQLIFFSLLNIF